MKTPTGKTVIAKAMREKTATAATPAADAGSSSYPWATAEWMAHRRRVLKSQLHRDLRKLLADGDDLFQRAYDLADQLDDCPPDRHPFRMTAMDEGSDWAAADLRALARTLNVLLGAFRGEL